MARVFILAQRWVHILGIIHTLQWVILDVSFSLRIRPLGRRAGGKGVPTQDTGQLVTCLPEVLIFLKACSSFLSLIFPMHTYVVSECLKLLKMTEGKDSSTVRSCLSRDHWSTATKRGLSSPPSPAAPLWEEIKGKMNRTCSGQPAPSWWRGPHLLDFQWALSPLITGLHQAVQASVSGRCGPWACGAESCPRVSGAGHWLSALLASL